LQYFFLRFAYQVPVLEDEFYSFVILIVGHFVVPVK
jgi:hypothetical protein